MAYPIETILAEKYETILKRNILSTRARDLYDIYGIKEGNKMYVAQDDRVAIWQTKPMGK